MQQFGRRRVHSLLHLRTVARFKKLYNLIITMTFVKNCNLGFGCCLAYTGVIFSLSTYFQKWFSLVVSLTTTGVGIGMFTFGPLTEALLNEYGWRGAYLICGAISLHLTLLGSLLYPLREERNGDRNGNEPRLTGLEM